MNSDSTYIDNLIARYLTGETTREEWEELLYWMENSSDNKKYFDGVKFVHDKAVASHRIVKMDTEKAWNKLSSKLTLSEEQTPSKKFRVPVYKKTWFRVAAGFALLLGISTLFYIYLLPSRISTVPITIASTNSVIKHTLNDNTEITLNQSSKISVKTIKSEKKKEIELSGEAFISVNHASDTSIIIIAEETFIRDIGTAFNVKAYPDNNLIEVFVQSGSVAFYTDDNEGISLSAGETGLYDRTKKTFSKIDAVDINAIAYKKLFIFHDISLKKALAELNKVYSQKILMQGAQIENCTITVTFDNESTGAIADIIAETLGLKVSMNGGNYYLIGDQCFSHP